MNFNNSFQLSAVFTNFWWNSLH